MRRRYGCIRLERARVHANEAQFLHKWIDARLEHLRDQGRGRLGLQRDFLGRQNLIGIANSDLGFLSRVAVLMETDRRRQTSNRALWALR